MEKSDYLPFHTPIKYKGHCFDHSELRGEMQGETRLTDSSALHRTGAPSPSNAQGATSFPAILVPNADGAQGSCCCGRAWRDVQSQPSALLGAAEASGREGGEGPSKLS